MNTFDNYNKILSVSNNSNYPYNLISNLKHNVIETKKEVDLEYVKNYVLQSTDKKGGLVQKDIVIYFY